MIILKELAIRQSELLIELRAASKQILTHLFKIFYLGSKVRPSTVTHWEKDIYSFLNDIDYLKNSNRRPSGDLIFRGLWLSSIELFDSRHKKYVQDINKDYGKSYGIIKTLDPRAETFCMKYMKWLSEELYKRGEVYREDVEEEIEKLRDEFSR